MIYLASKEVPRIAEKHFSNHFISGESVLDNIKKDGSAIFYYLLSVVQNIGQKAEYKEYNSFKGKCFDTSHDMYTCQWI